MNATEPRNVVRQLKNYIDHVKCALSGISIRIAHELLDSVASCSADAAALLCTSRKSVTQAWTSMHSSVVGIT